MKTGAIILARMSSCRLPGKVLRDLAGRPLLEHVLDRTRRIRAANQVIVATSSDPSDDPIARYCHARGVAVYRGAMNDVARRLLDCAVCHDLDVLARINADSPFLDPESVAIGMVRAIQDRLDFVTNIHPRSFPYGVAVEVMRTDALAAAYGRMDQPGDFEHVTPYFYRHALALRFANLTLAGPPCDDIRLTVDDERDLLRAANLIEHLGSGFEFAGLQETIAACRAIHASKHATALSGV